MDRNGRRCWRYPLEEEQNDELADEQLLQVQQQVRVHVERQVQVKVQVQV